MNTDWKDNYWHHRIKGNSALMSFIRATLTLFSTWPTDVEIDLPMSGHEKLHAVFGLSYAKWLNLPRSLMCAMPDNWQERMAELLDEFADTFDIEKMTITYAMVQVMTSNGYSTDTPTQTRLIR